MPKITINKSMVRHTSDVSRVRYFVDLETDGGYLNNIGSCDCLREAQRLADSVIIVGDSWIITPTPL